MDYRVRKAAILARMVESQIDWFFVSNLFNIRYLSGFSGSRALLLISPERQLIFTDGRYQEQVASQVSEFEPVIEGRRKEYEALRDILGDLSAKRVWFEAEHVSHARFLDFTEKLPAREYLPARRTIEILRRVKEEAEIDAMRRALSVAENAYRRAMAQVREGMTERELGHLIEHEMWAAGAEKESFESLVLFGERGSLPHGKPSNRALRKGDAILTDFGCEVDGYCSDITRMASLGAPSDELRSMCAAVREANLRAAEAIRAGVTGVEADKAARQVIEAAGRGDQFIHGLGHGVGLQVHEAPRLSYLSEDTLEAGNVVTIEPGVYVPGVGGVRLEDMGVVRQDRCEILNETPPELLVL